MKLKNNIIQVKDHLVSGENFKVVYNEPLGYASTQIQKQTDLSTYYPKTDYASHKEKPKGLKGKAYVMVQQFMLRYKHSIIKQHLSGINLLDFGGGIGVFANHVNANYVEIMKMLADEKKLFIIVATTDYIYGTNYQFCHGYLSKDLQNMTQEKLIQALGRVGRKNIQKSYSIRLRNNNIVEKLFMEEENKIEVRNMNRLFA